MLLRPSVALPLAPQAALGVILEDNTAKTKPAGVFGSFGWSGEAIDEIEQRLKDAGFSFAFPPIRCKFKVGCVGLIWAFSILADSASLVLFRVGSFSIFLRLGVARVRHQQARFWA